MKNKTTLGSHIVAICSLPLILTGCSTEPVGRALVDSGLGVIILGFFGLLIVGGILHQIFAKGNVAAALIVIAVIVVIFLLLK
jgi:hypothetical protein